jgi:hypothetical protein
MSKLLHHFKTMQDMASRYLKPGPYTDREGRIAEERPEGGTSDAQAYLFIADMIYMLDGPEQREAEEAEEIRQREIVDLEVQLSELAAKLAVANSDRKRATDKLDAYKAEANDLRDRLFESELAYAKLRGYIARIDDERPPVMVPKPRERYLSQLPDGSTGTEMPDFDQLYHHRTDRPKRWYHR